MHSYLQTLALCFFASVAPLVAQSLPEQPIAATTRSNYQYLLIAPTDHSKWKIIRIDSNASSKDAAELLYEGSQPFTPQASESLSKKLGYDVEKELISQWVASVIADGIGSVKKTVSAYYAKTGKPMFTGLTADVFRSQGVDPEARPPDTEFQ